MVYICSVLLTPALSHNNLMTPHWYTQHYITGMCVDLIHVSCLYVVLERASMLALIAETWFVRVIQSLVIKLLYNNLYNM